MPGRPVVALWGVPCSGQSPGKGGPQRSPGLLHPGVQRERVGVDGVAVVAALAQHGLVIGRSASCEAAQRVSSPYRRLPASVSSVP